ncbi:IS66 family insertion sequence element accessory protein TnpB [Rhodomicrobium lacus]|uniref:IS66 family insertion sequence element accessory protein TnpB n=1 Tax=Rhodomicrobium lacus TaxID=2498452 RepID=UPI003CCB656E
MHPPRIYIATRPIDFRKGMDGLAAAIQAVLKLDPFCGAAFIFRSKRADRTVSICEAPAAPMASVSQLFRC